MEPISIALLAVTVAALVGAIYFGTGARAWFGHRESPEKIMGASVRLVGGDGLGPVPPEIPPARVESFDGQDYRLKFESPLVLDGTEEHFALVRSRHQGYPISGAKRRHTAAGAVLESGRGFIAEIEIVG